MKLINELRLVIHSVEESADEKIDRKNSDIVAADTPSYSYLKCDVEKLNEK